jgi:hypothetical protein
MMMYTAVEPRKLSHAAACKAFQGVLIGGLSSIRTTNMNDVVATSLKIPELLISWNLTKTVTQIQQGSLTRQFIRTSHEISGTFTELCFRAIGEENILRFVGTEASHLEISLMFISGLANCQAF